MSDESVKVKYVPACIRSGSFADIGPRRYMEDEHVRIDDLSNYLGSACKFPKPSAFYGVVIDTSVLLYYSPFWVKLSWTRYANVVLIILCRFLMAMEVQKPLLMLGKI